MGIKNSILLLVLLGLVRNGFAELFGVVTEFGGDDTRTVVLTVQIDPSTGDFSTVVENFIYVGSSISYDGISTFDQKNEYFYYSSNYDSSFVFGLDVANKELLPPISIGAQTISTVDWDGTNNQLLINGLFSDGSSVLLTLPSSGPSVELINFTTMGVSYIHTTVLDWKTGTYYVSYYSKKNQYEIGSFSLSDTSSFTTTLLGCGQYTPDYIFFDSPNGGLLGTGFTAQDYTYFQVKDKKCTTSILDLANGLVTAASFDPTTATLYLGYVDDNGSALLSFNTTSKTLSRVPTLYVLEDLQVSYQV